MLEFQLGMALGEKLFEESGNVTGFKVTKVHPTEGVTMEVSFASEITGYRQISKRQKYRLRHHDSISSWHS